MHWDDLRYVLAVAEEGSMNRAARRLEVNHATVLRRIARLETETGRPIFGRQANSYRLTPAGQALVSVATDVEQLLSALDERGGPDEISLRGSVRVTTTDSLMIGLLTDPMAAFQRSHPGVMLEFSITSHLLDLSRRHADVAIRPTRAPPSSLHGVRIGDLAFGIYCAADYPLRDREITDPAHRWLVVDESAMASPTQQWLQRHVPGAIAAIRADSFVVLGEAACRGLGLTLLPCFMADTRLPLIRLHGPLDEITNGLWILRRPEGARVARVAALCDSLAVALAEHAPLLAGRLA
ncbi:MAG: LysR family transcriptional regulator [Burkholderiaceae bacterium]